MQQIKTEFDEMNHGIERLAKEDVYAPKAKRPKLFVTEKAL